MNKGKRREINGLPERIVSLVILSFAAACIYFQDILICSSTILRPCSIKMESHPLIFWAIVSGMLLVGVVMFLASFRNHKKKYKRHKGDS